MANEDVHSDDCLKELGKEYRDVHRFLDQFAKIYGFSHRRILHHTYGIEMVRFFMGEMEAKAAEIHIKRDCHGEIPEPSDWLDSDYWLNTGEISDIPINSESVNEDCDPICVMCGKVLDDHDYENSCTKCE